MMLSRSKSGFKLFIFLLLAAILCLVFLSGCRAGDGQQEADAPGSSKNRPPEARLGASIIFYTTAAASSLGVDAASLNVDCLVSPADGGLEPQCFIGLAGLRAAGWQGIVFDGRREQVEQSKDAAEEAKRAAELIAAAKLMNRESDGSLWYHAAFYLQPETAGSTGESLTRQLKISCWISPKDGQTAADQAPTRVAAWEDLFKKHVSLIGTYLVASPLVVRPGDEVSVFLKSDRPHEIKAELALGLSCPGIGLVKNYGRLKDNHAQVKIPPDLPAGNYYFLAADPKFRVNSGVGTWAYIQVVNPDILPVDPGKVPRRLVARSAPVYSRPEAAAPRYHTLPPGAVVRVLAVKEAAGERWYWAQVNVYETGRERVGWLRAAATVPINPENYRAAREVRLRRGAKYYEHERFRRGDLSTPGEWHLPEEVLWIVQRREQMVRLRPSEDIVLAVDGDIWAAEADLVYFRGGIEEE